MAHIKKREPENARVLENINSVAAINKQAALKFLDRLHRLAFRVECADKSLRGEPRYL